MDEKIGQAEEQKGAQEEITVDVMLSVVDQKDFITFYAMEKNPLQKYYFMGVLLLGIGMIVLQNLGMPPWIGFAAIIALIAMLIRIWLERRKATRIIRGPWLVLNKLLFIWLNEEGITEIQPEEDEEALDTDSDDSGTVGGVILRSGSWSELSNAYENDLYFYIFINDSEAFILQKRRMTEETGMEIRASLSAHMGERFRPRNDKKEKSR